MLIANVLNPLRIKELAKLARSLSLEVILEVRDRIEMMDSLNEYIDIVGVNNRNLKDFSVDLSRSFEMASFIPKEILKISESGISTVKVIHELKNVGYHGFLIGDAFMQHSRPEIACTNFIKKMLTE